MKKRIAVRECDRLAGGEPHEIRREPLAALLDLDLPGVNGLDLARLIRARDNQIPLLAVTARADADAEPDAYAAGMDGFLRKPVTGVMLADALEALLLKTKPES